MKPTVCHKDPESTEQMKELVKETLASVHQDMLQRVMANLHRRYQLSVAAQESFFEA